MSSKDAVVVALAGVLFGCSTSVSLGDPSPNGAAESDVIDVAPPPPDPSPAAGYPSGPYGRQEGDVVADFSWKGYRDGKGSVTDIRLGDYYDPDGSKGLRALKVCITAAWCVTCNAEAGRLATEYGAVRDRGGKYVALMVQDATHAPARQATLDAWIGKYHPAYDLCIDASATIAPAAGGSVALPYNVIVDPRTMRIEKIVQGDGPSADASVDALIAKNGG